MRAFGSHSVCALLHRLPKQSAHAFSIRLQTVRAFSAQPNQMYGEKQSQQAWFQHLLKLSLGLGTGTGLLASYVAFSSSECEQQASAGQTKVSNSSLFQPATLKL